MAAEKPHESWKIFWAISFRYHQKLSWQLHALHCTITASCCTQYNSVDPCQDLQLPALHLYNTSNPILGSSIEPLEPLGYRPVALRQASVCQDSALVYLFCSIAWLCSECNWLVS